MMTMADAPLLQELLKLAERLAAEKKPVGGNGWVTFKDGAEVSADLAWYACNEPVFKALGLRKHVVSHSVTGKPVWGEPQIGPKKGWRPVGIGAMEKLFSITRDEAEYLFGGEDVKILEMEGWEAIEGGIYPDVDYSWTGVIARLRRVIDGEFE
jgi:hypothetical protein